MCERLLAAYCIIVFGKFRKTLEIYSQNIQYSGRDLNQEPLGYEGVPTCTL
jgi:hypothetical protein